MLFIKNSLSLISISLSLAIGLGACSKSEPSIEENITLKTSFSFHNVSSWPERYNVELGVFGEDTINPIKYVTIDPQSEAVVVSSTLDKVSSQARSMKLYIANIMHQPLFTFVKETISTENITEVTIPQKDINMISFGRIQAQVFSNCTVCHGGSNGEPAAGMKLMVGVSYTNLVNHSSTNSIKNRVTPSSIDNSFIIDVLRITQNVFVHSASNTIAEEDIQLLEAWIYEGALNN